MKFVPLMVRFCGALAVRSFVGLKLDTVGEGLVDGVGVLWDPPQPVARRMAANEVANQRRSGMREQGMVILLDRLFSASLPIAKRNRQW